MRDKLTEVLKPDDAALHKNSDAPAAKAERHAAVLIPLVRHEDQWQILFIRRAKNERDRHSGQVAFPGGRIEPGDANAVAAAIRETHEEIGVHADLINVLGIIDAYITVSSYEVTPVIGVVDWPTPLRLQSSEVARAFLIPLSWLRDRNNFTVRARQNMDPQSARRHPIIVFEPFDEETLWGATARMTLNFLKAVDDGKIRLPLSP
ncbi:MAG: CoA pyrophosphatase [Granulosicoccus sp.]